LWRTINHYKMIPRFCIQNRITDREATPCTVAQLLEVMASEHVQTICDQIKLLDQEYPNGGNERDEELARLKKQLPVITPHAQKFINNERKNQNAIPSGLVMLDMDDIPDPRACIDSISGDSFRANQIYFVAITPSGHGLRLIAERQSDESIANAQQRLYDLLISLSPAGGVGGGHFDSSTKDPARASFVMPRSYLLYLDASGLEFETEEEAQKVATREATIVEPLSRSNDREATIDSSPAGGGQEGATYQGLPYKDIISQLVMLLGGEPEVGARNTFYFSLVMYARYICDFQSDILLAVLPDFGLSVEERRGVINSAVNRPRKATVPDMVTRALAMAQAAAPSDSPGRGEESEWPVDQEALPMPKLPTVLNTICRRLPQEFHPAMVIAALPVLGTLATKVRFTYLDHQKHSFSFMSCITAPAATGKSFIRRPINLLLTPIDEQDEVEREKEQEYKEKLRVAKNAKVQPENPRACPRNNGINISVAKLLQLLTYSEGKHLIGIGEEIDTLVKSERAGVWSQKSDIYRLGFDNAKYGQNYMSDNSFSANVPVYYNLLLTGTPGGMYRFFKDVEDGLVTRCCFAQLPDMFGTDIPDFQPYSKSEEESIIRTARMLDMTEGTIYCKAVDEAIGEWLRAKKQQAIEADSRAIDTVRRRAAVIGFRAGYLAALLNGSATKSAQPSSRSHHREAKIASKSEPSSRSLSGGIEASQFALWVAEYVFRNQMQLFGGKFEQVANEQLACQQRKGSATALIYLLPQTFTKAELIALRARKGQSTDVSALLHRWILAGIIEQVTKNQYKKGPNYGKA